jgi:hypothetical protein
MCKQNTERLLANMLCADCNDTNYAKAKAVK